MTHTSSSRVAFVAKQILALFQMKVICGGVKTALRHGSISTTVIGKQDNQRNMSEQGTAISDRHWLTVSHLGGIGYDDPLTDLQIQTHEPGTFSEWVTIALEPMPLVSQVTVHTQDGPVVALAYNTFENFPIFKTHSTIRSGDSGMPVFHEGTLVGVNYGINRDLSFHIDVGARSDWINETITPIPEPSPLSLIVFVGILFVAGWVCRDKDNE